MDASLDKTIDERVLNYVEDAKERASQGSFGNPNVKSPSPSPSGVLGAAKAFVPAASPAAMRASSQLPGAGGQIHDVVSDAGSAIYYFPGTNSHDPASWLQDRIVILIIGEEETKWAVHEKLLSSKSPYFDRILNGSDEHRGTTEIAFKDTEPKLFSMLLRWIYGTTFAPSTGNRIFRYPRPDGVNFTVSE
jgi:hypothetical protein